MEAIQMQAMATHNLVQQMAMQRDSTANANMVFYDFLKLHPPTFQGGHNPSEAQTQGNHMNWEHFEVAFLDKYYPKSSRRQKELEFVHLQQGDMSVAEYVVKFEELARFSPHAQYAPTKEWKINQFEWGLRPEIRGNIGHMELTNYSTLVHKSYIVEDNLKKVQEERQVKWQQKKESGKFGQQLKVKTPQGKGKQVQTSSSPRAKKCFKCGRDHAG
ncbi:uncharacterized protein [Cicer arietinum]|uniref:uncharacterized protein n=1 Tax=Cicer arietinum TaxID=3827 RepID=UPI003CC619E4